MSKNIFITGTGTDVGKTFVTGLILKKLKESGLRAAYYKAAMSGNERAADGKLMPGDALHVKQVSGISQPLSEMCPYVYEAAVSPHLASRTEGNPVSMEVVREGFLELCRNYDFVTMEGSGGILCPIHIPVEKEYGAFDGGGNAPTREKSASCRSGVKTGRKRERPQERELWLEDVIRELGLASLIVADAGLGTINSAVLTAEYMRAKGLSVKGIILNRFHPGDWMEEDNLRMCEYRTKLPVIACVREDGGELEIEAEKLTALYEPAVLQR